jgi:hypothetical protein
MLKHVKLSAGKIHGVMLMNLQRLANATIGLISRIKQVV